jgi:hypothetical protein
MNEIEGLSPWASEETKFREICEVKICQAVTWFNVPLPVYCLQPCGGKSVPTQPVHTAYFF